MGFSLLLLNGPNLNLLGEREPDVYGVSSLADIERRLSESAAALGVRLDCMQSNHEGVLIDAIHAARGKYNGILLNAGAYTHTSVAMRDAISGVSLPCVEIHLSNIHAREEFRHRSLIAPVCIGVVAGFGENSYVLGLNALSMYLKGDERG